AGVDQAVREGVARRLARGQGVLSCYCMGMGQSTVGTWKCNSLINLHLLTGQIGKPGAGPFSLTGQPNAMGGREAGLLSHQLPGYRTVENPEHRRQVEDYWQRPRDSIRPKIGLTAVEMFRALEKGQLPECEIVARMARAMGYEGFGHASAAEVWDEFIGLTSGRPCDMAGATAARLRRLTSLQWPCPTSEHPGTKRRYLDRRFPTPDG